MYTDTVTLFNRYQSRLGDTWYPTILHNVHLDMDKAAIIAKYGPESSDNAVLHVKYKMEEFREYAVTKDEAPIPDKSYYLFNAENETYEKVDNLISFKKSKKYYEVTSSHKGIGVSGKEWLPPKEWDAQPNDSFSTTLTFTDGTDFDFFMLGEWEGGEEPISDDDYLEGLYNELNKRYDYVFAITAVGGPYKTIPHFEIMGR